MAENFWDVLEGRTSESRGATSSAVETAPAFVPAPAAPERRVERAAPAAPERRVERAAPAERRAQESEQPVFNFTPDPARTAENAATAAMAVKEQMPEPAAASPTKDFMDNILGLWQIPAAVAGYEVVRRTYKAMKDSGTPSTRSLGDIDVPFNRPVETTATSAPPARTTTPAQTVMTAGGPVNLSEVPPEMRPMVERSAQVTQQKMTAPTVPPMGVAPAPVVPAPMAPITPPTLADVVEGGGNVTKAVQADVAKAIDAGPAAMGAAPPAAPAATPAAAPVAPAGKERMKSTFKSAADVPAGMVFRPDVGNVDRALFNILGPEHRQNAKDLLNKGQPFGNAPDVNDRVSKITNEYWKAVQGQIPETILGREARIAQGVPHQGFGAFGGLGRAVKVGGVAGTLLTAAEAALAAQQGRYGQAAVQAADVATDFIPGVAVLKQALTGSTLAPGTLPPEYIAEQQRRASLLGSPTAATRAPIPDWAKPQAGGGRGFVNPPQFR